MSDRGSVNSPRLRPVRYIDNCDYGISPSDTTEFNSAIGVNGRAWTTNICWLQSIVTSAIIIDLNWNATTDALSFMIYEIDGTSPVYQTVTNASEQKTR